MAGTEYFSETAQPHDHKPVNTMWKSHTFAALIRQSTTTHDLQAPVVQMLDSAIHRINHYPADKYLGNQSHYPLYKDLQYPQDSAIHLLNNWGQTFNTSQISSNNSEKLSLLADTHLLNFLLHSSYSSSRM